MLVFLFLLIIIMINFTLTRLSYKLYFHIFVMHRFFFTPTEGTRTKNYITTLGKRNTAKIQKVYASGYHPSDKE